MIGWRAKRVVPPAMASSFLALRSATKACNNQSQCLLNVLLPMFECFLRFQLNEAIVQRGCAKRVRN